MELHFATIRKDLQASELSVPVGNSYYADSKPLPYRWVNDRQFQVLINNKWEFADSIDWEFDS